MMWYYGGGDGWSWLWAGAALILFLGGAILLGIWAVRSLSSPKRTGDTAIEILRRRLAAGEISPEDFEKTRKVLGG